MTFLLQQEGAKASNACPCSPVGGRAGSFKEGEGGGRSVGGAGGVAYLVGPPPRWCPGEDREQYAPACAPSPSEVAVDLWPF